MFENTSWVADFFMIVGILRIINKPIFEAVRYYVNLTPNAKDNELLEQIEKSPSYRAFLFALDWFASVKLKKP